MSIPNKTNSRMSIMIGIMAALLLCAGVVSYFFLNSRMTEINELRSQLSSLNQAADQSLALRSIVATTKDARDKMKMYFITKATVGSFISELETYAEHATVVLTLSAPSVEKDKQISPDKFLKFSVRAEGEFEHIFHFLKLVELMPYKIKVTSVKIDKLESENTKSKLWFEEITFNLVSYIDK